MKRMFQTKITELLGIKYPIVVGTMMHLARAEMVAAASNAGALGVLSSATFQKKEEFREECPLHPNLKKAFLEATELDTMVIMRSIQNSHRVWINESARKVAELEKKQAALPEIINAATGDRARKMFQEGDLNAGTISCGQGIGLVHKIMPMKDIIESIIHQADDLRKKVASL
jgi:nitronate monooxygenase